MDIESEIKRLTIGQGFCSVGITTAEQVASARKVLPEAVSIISVAYSYPAYYDIKISGLRGWIARFARGRDYHLEVRERLQTVGDWLAASYGAKWASFVDTSPISDRRVAQLAGVGGYGKNTCIITAEAGSWVVLGGIVTDLALSTDEPVDSPCGDCSICLEACPTGAIVSPYKLDPSRCISNLTQMRGVIPGALRPAIGDRVYGCDVCQEVCPKNRLTPPPEDYLSDDRLLSDYPDLAWLINITEDEFRRLVKPTAVGWIGRSTLRRNAAVALGNSGSFSALKVLREALKDSDAVLREHVQWAIRQIEEN